MNRETAEEAILDAKRIIEPYLGNVINAYTLKSLEKELREHPNIQVNCVKVNFESKSLDLDLTFVITQKTRVELSVKKENK